MIRKKSLPVAFMFILIFLSVGLFAYDVSVVKAKAKINNEKVEQMLRDDYEYDLTQLIILRKNSKIPELVILEDLKPQVVNDLSKKTKEVKGSIGHISSKSLNENNKDLPKNQERYDKLKNKLTEFLNDETIEFVQPNYIYTPSAWSTADSKDTPNDYSLVPDALNGNHWYYEKSNLRELWNMQGCTTGGEGCGGSSEVVVAVIDTGLAFESYTSAWDGMTFGPAPDIVNVGASQSINLWVNVGEISRNNIDEDGWYGVVDDYNGFNAENFTDCYYREICQDSEGENVPLLHAESGHPNDDYGHGTYVTGLIASLVDNGLDSVSPAQNVRIMPIKSSDFRSPYSSILDIYWSIIYAVDHGADIINMSLGSVVPSDLGEMAVNYAHQKGVLVIAASGNDNGGVNYPAKYSNVIAVGAVNANGSKSSYSNYGPELDLVAYVGDNETESATYQSSYNCFTIDPLCLDSSNFNLNRYTQFSNQYSRGTSYAAPQVAAAAAIILGNNPGMSNEELRLALLASVNDVGPVGFDNYTGYGVIDYKKAHEFVSGTEETENLTVYRYIDGDGAWIWVGNPDLVNPVYVYASIGGITKGIYSLEPQKTLPLSYPGLFDGPVKIVGSGPIHVSSKARAANGNLHESLAIPSTDYNTRFYYPVYRYVNGDGAWLWIANPGTQTTANVQITLGGQDRGSYKVFPGETLALSAPGEFIGPVVVNSDINVYTTLKTRTGGGLDELPGISQSDMSTSFYYPVYRYVNGDGAWLWLGNPSTSVVANVTIRVAGNEMGQYTIQPNSNLAVSYEGIFDGPVVINSDINIYSTLKSRTNDTINEFKGIATNEFSTSYYYPVYRYVSGDGAWLWIGNPDNIIDANITVKIAGNEMGQYTIAPNSNIAVSYPGVFTGPVSITSDIPVYSTLKSRSYGNLNEFVGAND